VDESVLGRLQRCLCAALCNGHMDRLANYLSLEGWRTKAASSSVMLSEAKHL
jgi:hypothetical protein